MNSRHFMGFSLAENHLHQSLIRSSNERYAPLSAKSGHSSEELHVRQGTISGPKSAERRLKRPFRCYFPPPATYLGKRLGSIYRRGRSPHWVKVKNPNAPTVKRRADVRQKRTLKERRT
jgi:hypothetical protein